MKSMLVKMCPNCKYCYGDISTISNEGKRIIETVDYQNQIANTDFPNVANLFLCKSMILEAEENITQAAWSALHAAWCCDDSENQVQARICRTRAIELFQLANNIGEPIFEKGGEFVCLIVDLNRKCGNLSVARQLAELRLKLEDDELCRKILSLQKYLCKNKDLATYTIETAHEHAEAFYQEDDWQDEEHGSRNSDRDYFDAMTDGQLGDYDDFREKGGNIDDVDDLIGR
jgi:hypothetical protein